jgi:SAM-dependent methyltransferase
MTSVVSRLDPDNLRAWEALYASTPRFIWGADAVGFLRPFLTPLRQAGWRRRRALDAATGEGRNLRALLEVADEVKACDASPAALAKIPTDVAARITRVQCDLAQTSFADGEFDFILLSDTVETLPNLPEVLRELRRVLAPDGVLVCNVPEPEGDVAGVEMEPVDGSGFLYRGKYYYRFMDEADFLAVLKGTGLVARRSEIQEWTEAAHPGFRDAEHRHRSRVFLLAPDQASAAPSGLGAGAS